MDSLLHIVSARAPEAQLLMGSGETSSSSALVEDCRALREGMLAPLQGRPVTLRCHQTLRYIKLLIALDGWASRILLVDHALENDKLRYFEQELGLEWRIGDGHVQDSVSRTGFASIHSTGTTEWIVPTSGTTGEPKLIAHDFRSLTRALKPANEKSKLLRWGLLYSPTRFAGLQVLLQALVGGSAIIAPDDPADVDAAVPLLARHRCNALSATPSLWRKLAFSGHLGSLELEIVTLGGEAADQKILDTLRACYPQATIRHIYASTEAGVGFSVADGRSGFPLSYLDSPPPGIQLRMGENGMLLLRPKSVAQRMVSSHPPLSDHDGWILTGDLVEVRDDRCHFLGRESGAINVGGQKVHPGHVEEILLEVPGVVATRVFGKPNPVLGALVAADVVAEPGTDPSELRRRIAEHCKHRLERYQTPALINFVEAFNLTSAGKLKR